MRELGCSEKCEFFFFSVTEEAPPRIRQSRSCRRREQSFAQSGVRHALLPPAGDGCSAPCGAELFLFSDRSLYHRIDPDVSEKDRALRK
jgi:hypothetical protein